MSFSEKSIDIQEIKRRKLDYPTLIGSSFDKIVVFDTCCLRGVLDRCIFNSNFEELNEICWLPSPLTSYIGLEFYWKEKRVGFIKCFGDWGTIKALSSKRE